MANFLLPKKKKNLDLIFLKINFSFFSVVFCNFVKSWRKQPHKSHYNADKIGDSNRDTNSAQEKYSSRQKKLFSTTVFFLRFLARLQKFIILIRITCEKMKKCENNVFNVYVSCKSNVVALK